MTRSVFPAKIDVQEGIQQIWVGESIAFTIDTQGSDTDRGWAAAPSAVGTAVLYYTDTDSDVTSAQASGSASVSGDIITTPTITPTSTGRYILVGPATVSGNTQYYRVVMDSDNFTPT